MQSLLVLGGARSGKSRYAERRARESGLTAIYIATAEALDAEMQQRIEHHRNERGPGWETVEAPLDVAGAIRTHAAPGRVLLVDCLTLWISNLLLAGREIEPAVAELAAAIEGAIGPVILVSNEVGSGIVPDNALARSFRDEAGRANQRLAAVVSEVQLIVAGLPLSLKSASTRR